MCLNLERFWEHFWKNLRAHAGRRARQPTDPATPRDAWNEVLRQALADCQGVIEEQFCCPVIARGCGAGGNGEWLLDVVFTNYSHSQAVWNANRKIPHPGVCRYEMLLAAELEMDPHFKDDGDAILEDFLKLLVVKSRIKIMAYRARGVNKDARRREHSQMRRQFEQAFCMHQDFDRTEAWLFLGIEEVGANGKSLWPAEHGPDYHVTIIGGDKRLRSPGWQGTINF